MEQRFAYYNGSRWIGGFDTRQAAVDHSRNHASEVYPNSLLDYWQEVVTSARPRRGAAAPEGSMASFLALGQ